MRISCPDCSAAYDVPDAMLSAGREVRCARCGGSWAPLVAPGPSARPAPPEAIAASPEQTPPEALIAEPSVAELVEEQPPPSRGEEHRLALAWSGSLVLLALGAAGLAFFHEEVAAAWPSSVRLFRAVGLS